jgi:hypothetical protein
MQSFSGGRMRVKMQLMAARWIHKSTMIAIFMSQAIPLKDRCKAFADIQLPLINLYWKVIRFVSVDQSWFLILHKEIRVAIKSRTRGLNTQHGRTRHAEPRKTQMRDEDS